jgi:transcriptional regulator with XRE-family HTH domain
LDHYETIASELIRALRGRRSRAELSRIAGYRTNMVQRWEAGHSFPVVTAYLRLLQRLRPTQGSWIARFFAVEPAWSAGMDPASRSAVVHFLADLRGKTPMVRVAARCGCNRYTVARWLTGAAEPKLPDFLRLADASSRRVVDLVAAFEDPTRLPAVREAWARLQLLRQAAQDMPWSHAVLRTLELRGLPSGCSAQRRFIASRLDRPLEEVSRALDVMVQAGQVTSTSSGYILTDVETINTNQSAEQAERLHRFWWQTASERLQRGAPGHFGYSLFAVARADLERLSTLHLQYVRAMQDVIAASSPADCVGLYCSHLLELSSSSDGSGCRRK